MEETFITDGMNFELNNATSEATLIRAEGIINIPKSIIVNSKEYKITKILENSLDNVYEVTISPDNMYFKMLNNKLLLSKSDNNADFDTIIFSQDIKQVTIPSFIKHIISFGNNRKNLKSILFSDDSRLQTINKYAFAHSRIKTITIPPGVKEINPNTFSYCFDLNTVQFPSNSQVQIFHNEAFFDSSIKHLIIPPTCKEIGQFCFDKCQNLKSIEFPINSQLEKICEMCFLYSRIESITIPSKVKLIEKQCFSNIKQLKKVIIAENSQLEVIGDYAFANIAIESISIPSSVKIIGNSCFSNCEKLLKISFPENSKLELIGDYAFSNTLISSINITSKVQLNSKSLYGMKCLTNINLSPNNMTYKYFDNRFMAIKSNQEIDVFDKLFLVHQKKIDHSTIFSSTFNFTIPSYIKEFNSSCFSGFYFEIDFASNWNLLTIDQSLFSKSRIGIVKIPSSVEVIGPNAFLDCENLKTVKFSSDSKLKLIDKCAFKQSGIEMIIIPSKVETIGEYSFSQCKKLKTVVFPPQSNLKLIDNGCFENSSIECIIIPSQVEKIGESSFAFCDKLDAVFFSNDSKLTIIGKNAFKNSSLNEITIPSQVESITESFAECAKLKKVIFLPNSKLKTISKNSFRESGIESITIPSQIEKIDSSAFHKCNNLKTVEFSENSQLEIIGVNSFEESGIESITIPSQVKTIDSYAFHKCNNFKIVKFTFDSKLTLIGKCTFKLTSISSITIPSNVETIGSSSFEECLNLKKVIFPTNSRLQDINQSAFEKSGILNISIPKSVKYIGKCCFFGCKQLQKVTFPVDSNISRINEHTFSYSTINKLSIPSSVTTIEVRAFDCCENLKIFQIASDSNLNSVDEYSFGRSFKSVDKVISPISKIISICNSIQKCEYYGIDDIPPKQLHLEIIDETVDLDIIANDLKNIVEICTPNAKEVNLTIDCDFNELYVPRNAKLTGGEVSNRKHRIIFCKKETLNIDIMESDEFESLYTKANLKKPIGDGATSTVYKIPNENIPNSYYALKVYKCNKTVNNESGEKDDQNDNEWKSDDDDDDNDDDNEQEFVIDFEKIKYFFSEYEILNALNHPNIIKAYSIFLGDSKYQPAILLEYCGHKLVKSLNKLNDLDRIAIIYEIAKAMHYAHKFNIIHRDLKPENILLDSGKHVKICDFGISTIIDIENQRRTQTRTYGIGTLMFMAPELYDNKPYNQKVDVYAFGIIMYYILTKGSYPNISITDVVNGKEINIPSTINELSKNLIKRCTSFDYRSRPSFSEIAQIIYDNDFKLIDDIEIDITRIIDHINYCD